MTFDEITSIMDIPIQIVSGCVGLFNSIEFGSGVTWWSILLAFMLLSGILGTFFFIARR